MRSPTRAITQRALRLLPGQVLATRQRVIRAVRKTQRSAESTQDQERTAETNRPKDQYFTRDFHTQGQPAGKLRQYRTGTFRLGDVRHGAYS